MSKGSPVRQTRISGDIWDPAAARAAALGLEMPEVIRRCLAQFAAGGPVPPPVPDSGQPSAPPDAPPPVVVPAAAPVVEIEAPAVADPGPRRRGGGQGAASTTAADPAAAMMRARRAALSGGEAPGV